MVSGLGALGAIGAFGTGAIEGVETGLQISDQISTLKGNRLAAQAFSDLANLSPNQFPGPQAGPPMQTMGPGAGMSPPPMPPPQGPPGPPQAPPGQPSQLTTMGGGPGPQTSQMQPGMFPPQASPPGSFAGRFPLNPPQAQAFAPQPQQQPGFPQQPPQPRPQPQQRQPPTQAQQESQPTQQDMMVLQQTGVGWLTPQQLMQRIQQADPNADPIVKWKAFQSGMKLLNAGGQGQAMQLLNYLQRERHQEQTERRQQEREEQTQTRTGLMQFRQDPERTALQPALNLLEKRDATIAEFTNTAVRMGKEVISLGNKISSSGMPAWQAFVQKVKGWEGDPVVSAYALQLQGWKAEMAKILGGSPTAAVLTEGARTEANNFLAAEGTTVKQAQGVLTQFERDARIRKEEVDKQRTKILDRLRTIENAYKTGAPVPERTGEDLTPDPWPEVGGDTAPGAAAPGTAPGWGGFKVKGTGQ